MHHTSQTVQRIISGGIIAIIRTSSVDAARTAALAIAAGGIDAIEVTMTVPGALDLLAELGRDHGDRLLLGAGTVLNPESALAAIRAGARYIVSPHLNPRTVEMCLRHGVPSIPGCQTVTEAMTALEAGADLVKLFPAGVLGPEYVKAVLAALPQIPFVPTGGVGPHNAAAYIRAGAVAVGVGGELTRAGDAAAIAAVASELVSAVREARAR
ncbi:MAG: bifunctional 4-hydroxy-2-oxoglutarate aldolase/2-dehydro-3-deoxy-phosphogluconate aldolase [Bacillota bacterium]|nr:bifunctional 4-hydroxy-2-oxoglutarate aldolase/2-dehydro-3-deoxy-phosphogluconate aldolase [Bacillota bacterium]